ncbi:hypothetical protein EVAR_88146_1 [Eumeta japonica]|uniref:Uncharacterized protein n=1 Tax=Eumeta variegata TaxID=151549 RepID=A0A4C1WRS8_EUMVA|nr:hypothetical protein EVAR_88146_1 [Eumeta japonica]
MQVYNAFPDDLLQAQTASRRAPAINQRSRAVTCPAVPPRTPTETHFGNFRYLIDNQRGPSARARQCRSRVGERRVNLRIVCDRSGRHRKANKINNTCDIVNRARQKYVSACISLGTADRARRIRDALTPRSRPTPIGVHRHVDV